MNKENLIDLDKKQLALLDKIIKRHIPNKTVWAYGSRVTWKASEISDLDLVVFDCGSVEIADFKESLEESNLLISVDVMSWENIPDNFKKNIRKKYVVLQEKLNLEGWREVKLGDAIEIVGGGTPSTKKPEYWNGDIPWLSPPDFTDSNRWVTKTRKTITPLGLKNSATKILTEKSLIISARGTVGALAQLKKPMAFSQTNYGLKANSKFTNNDFLFYALKHNLKRIKQFSYGAVFDTITTSTFNAIKVSLPPISEQKVIAEVLSSLDDKIELLHRQNKTLENMAQTLFRQWFVEEVEDTWEVVKLGAVLSSIESGSRPTGGIDTNLKDGIASIGAESIKGIGKFDFSSTKYITDGFFQNMKKGKVQSHDVLIYKDGAYVGRKGMFGNGFPFKNFAVNEHVFILRGNNKITQSFLYFALDENKMHALNANSAQPGINQSAMKSFDLRLPPKAKMIAFDITAISFIDRIFSNSTQIRTIENLRDTLLPKLMTGNARVNTLKNAKRKI